MKNRFMLVTLSLLLVLGFSIHATAGETYKMGLSLAITRWVQRIMSNL